MNDPTARWKRLEAETRRLAAEKDTMLELLETEDRDFTEDEEAKYADLEKQVEAVRPKLEREKRQLAHVASLATQEHPNTVQDRLTLEADADARVEVGEPELMKDPKRGFKNLGEQAMAVKDASTPGSGKPLDQRLEVMAAATGMQQGVGSDGGHLVAPSFSDTIWDGMRTADNALLPLTDQYTVEGDSLEFNAIAETSRRTGSRWGGMRAYRIAEADQITSSKPKFRKVKIEPTEIAVLAYVTEKLLRNSPIALGQFLSKGASSEINFTIGDEIINGTGAGQMKGILNGTPGTNAARVQVSKETGQKAATIVPKNINKMWRRMWAGDRSSAVWFINQDIEAELDAMEMPIGTGGVPVYLPPGGIADTPFARLKGRPVIPIEFCATLGTEGDIILANLQAYATGVTGGGISSDESPHLRFDYAERAFRFMFAIDGRPWIETPLTPYKGTDTLSSFVTLQTRS